MDQPVPRGLKTTFLIHAIAGLIMGLGLLFIPGRSLTLLGWVPAMVQLPNSEVSIPGTSFIDPMITRLLGAALLALAYLSFRCWAKGMQSIKETHLVVEFEAVYCALSFIAILIALFNLNRPASLIIWACLLIYAGFFVAWGYFWQTGRRSAA